MLVPAGFARKVGGYTVRQHDECEHRTKSLEIFKSWSHHRYCGGGRSPRRRDCGCDTALVLDQKEEQEAQSRERKDSRGPGSGRGCRADTARLR